MPANRTCPPTREGVGKLRANLGPAVLPGGGAFSLPFERPRAERQQREASVRAHTVLADFEPAGRAKRVFLLVLAASPSRRPSLPYFSGKGSGACRTNRAAHRRSNLL